MVRHVEGLNRIFQTVLRSLSSVAYLIVLMIIFIIIFALAGRQLLAGKMTFDGEVHNSFFLFFLHFRHEDIIMTLFGGLV